MCRCAPCGPHECSTELRDARPFRRNDRAGAPRLYTGPSCCILLLVALSKSAHELSLLHLGIVLNAVTHDLLFCNLNLCVRSHHRLSQVHIVDNTITVGHDENGLENAMVIFQDTQHELFPGGRAPEMYAQAASKGWRSAIFHLPCGK